MKQKLIRALSLLSFLLLMLPFTQYCSHYKTGDEVVAEEIVTDTTDIPTPPPPLTDDTLQVVRYREDIPSPFAKNYAFNAYEYAYCVLDNELFEESATMGLMVICYVFVVLFSVVVVILTFRNKYRFVALFGIITVLTLLLSTVMHYFTGELHYWWQVKYGYYLFIINMLAIILIANKIKGCLSGQPL